MKERLLSKTRFIAEYASTLMGSGVHTSRVIRNSKRLGKALNVEVNISILQKNIILTTKDLEHMLTHSEVIDIPAYPISFEYNSEMSGLSWEAYDRNLPFEEIKEKYYKIKNSPRIHPLFVLILVGFANASFCRLFGGDLVSMGIVFSSTLVGFFIKQRLHANAINHFIIFIAVAFISSLCASIALIFDTTSEIALATSVLFLVPGVPLINGIIDIVEGYILTGFSRLTQALLLVICIAIGLSFTLYLVKDSLI